MNYTLRTTIVVEEIFTTNALKRYLLEHCCVSGDGTESIEYTLNRDH